MEETKVATTVLRDLEINSKYSTFNPSRLQTIYSFILSVIRGQIWKMGSRILLFSSERSVV